MEKYAIYVIDKLPELRDFKIKELLNIQFTPIINSNSYFIGGNNDKIKHINWYDNREYINTWSTKEQADEFLNFLLERAEKFYGSWKDPFRSVLNTKGDWKNFKFIVTKL